MLDKRLILGTLSQGKLNKAGLCTQCDMSFKWYQGCQILSAGWIEVFHLRLSHVRQCSECLLGMCCEGSDCGVRLGGVGRDCVCKLGEILLPQIGVQTLGRLRL